jgi:hypothetical protein
MWKSAYVGVYQLLNWKMHGETLKFERMDFYITVKLNIPHCLKNGCTFYHATLYSLPIQPKFKSVPLGEIG